MHFLHCSNSWRWIVNLAPEHVEDLRKSGLSESTIQACAFTAVRPSEISQTHVESAYAIPYHDLAGHLNCFCRTKLFPPITLSDGSLQKYDQPKGTDPQLYMPPLFSWQAVARDARLSIALAEGEKKRRWDVRSDSMSWASRGRGIGDNRWITESGLSFPH